MASLLQSTKRLQIDKANATMVAAIAVASFLFVFCLIASKALLSQRAYQAKVITKKEHARDTLKNNVDTAKTLTTAYHAFIESSPNIIKGDPNGSNSKDGDNAKIILDALPYKYDFPALAASIEQILSQESVKNVSISGSDDELAQQSNLSSPKPVYVPIPFQVNVSGSYKAIQSVIDVMERSIRPFQINTFSLQGKDSDQTLTLSVQTYYQPAVSLKIGSEVVK